jgi:protease I
MVDIRQANVLIIATAGFEETQLTVPQSKLNQAGAIVHIAAPKSRSGSESIRGRDKADRRKNVGYDQNIETINQNGYDALILPGGQINRDKLRLKPSALDVV